MEKVMNCEIHIKCRHCERMYVLKVNKEDFEKFESPNRPHIQEVFPYLSPEERELLISRTCGKCWNDIFGGDDDE